LKDSYTIGEFSKMFGLNVQTLRYYDSIGIFRPAYRDKWSGRRKYAFDQVYQLASIRYLRRIGYSLEDIAEYLDNLQSDTSLDVLKKRSDEIHRELDELLDIDHAIQRKIRFIEHELSEIREISEIKICEYGPRPYIPLGQEEVLYHHDSFYFYPTIAFYKEDLKYFGAYLYQDNSQFPEDFKVNKEKVEYIEAGKYLCAYHLGPYEEIYQTQKKLRNAYSDLKLSDLMVNFNIIDQFVEKDRSKYITSMQIRIL